MQTTCPNLIIFVIIMYYGTCLLYCRTVPLLKRSAPFCEILAKDRCSPPMEEVIYANGHQRANVIGSKAENWVGLSMVGWLPEYD